MISTPNTQMQNMPTLQLRTQQHAAHPMQQC